MSLGLLGCQLAVLEHLNLATKLCLNLSIALTPEQIWVTIARAVRLFVALSKTETAPLSCVV